MSDPLAIPAHNKKYIPALDGYRGFAMILVLVYHYFGAILPIFRLGWFGMELFFVLSGYLITDRLLANAERKNKYGLFYRNRVLRIMPLYYMVLIIFFACVFLLVKDKNFHRFDYYRENAASFFLFLENWTFIFKGKPLEQHFAHFWSLAVEEQFYLVWPWLLYAFFRAKHIKVYILGAIGVIIASRVITFFLYPHPVFAEYYYYHTFFRADAFLMGAILCFLPKTGSLIKSLPPIVVCFSSLCIAVGFIGSTSFTAGFFRSIGYSLLDLFSAAILFMIITRPKSLLTRSLNFSFLRFTGKISYGIYIFHWPILLVAGTYLAIFLKSKLSIGEYSAGILSLFICLILTYLLSFVSYKYYESWFLKKKK